jgi:adenine-specific DNA-methyltransferase
MLKLDGKTQDLISENITKLKDLFPEAFTEGKIDFEALRLILGDEIDTENERYSFTWHGKSEAIKLALKQSTGTLRPCKEESKHWDTTQNLFIEGDNLEVLRILQSSYRNKIKMIYIDPPYNTGNDFIYEDDFKDNVKHYKEKVSEAMKANPETAGRYHTNWLNMMYPRLKLARNLLREDGVIFISIDDNEVHNLRKICDEIFGEENFVAQFPWRKRTTKSDVPFGVSQDYEWIILYAKQFTVLGIDFDRKYYSSPDFPNNRWRLSDLTTQKVEADRPNSAFNLVDPKTNKIYKYNPNRLWGITKDTFDDYYTRGKIVFPDDYDFLKISVPAYRVFESEDREKSLTKFGLESAIKSVSTYLPKTIGMNEDGNNDITFLWSKKIFSYPKPVTLIKHFISVIMDKDSLILDFFSGSATTAHAVMKLNAEDGGNRKYIMVQIPEKCDEKSEAFKEGYKTIAEIGKERIRRAGEKIKAEMTEKDSQQLSLLEDKSLKANLDIGFKVFKLDETNFTQWDEETTDPAGALLRSVQSIKPNRTSEDALYEILLKYGIDLTLPVTELEIDSRKVFSLAANYLLVCLEKNLSLSTIEEIAKLKPERVVFYDDAFKDDVVKLNAEQTLRKFGVEDLRVI